MKMRGIEPHGDQAYLPIARNKEIVIQKAGNETLLYDLRTDKAHQLNETMSLIWNCCDGKISFGELICKLTAHTGEKIGRDFVDYALKELELKNLLEVLPENPDFDSVSRRSVILKYGTAAVAIPVVMSIVAPTASAQASCLPFASVCPGAVPCCPGLSCIDPGGGRPFSCA